MLTKLITAAGALASLAVLLSVFPTGGAHAAKPSPFDKARKQLDVTQEKLAGQLEDVKKLTTSASEATTPTALVDEIGALEKKCQVIFGLRNELLRTIGSFENLRSTTASEVEGEITLIHDSAAHDSVQEGYRQAYEESGKRILEAREAVLGLDRAIQSMEDLRHAKTALEGAMSLDMASQDLAMQITRAKGLATQLSAQTTNLIAKLTQPETPNKLKDFASTSSGS